jgi:thiamine-monophosphate kinase
MGIMAGVELEFVEWLRRRSSQAGAGVLVGIGDDMAVLDRPAGPILISSDMLLDGVHFDTSRHELADIGQKAVACCLSDCAAMAVRPFATTVSVALPRAWSLAQAQALACGMELVASAHDAPIVGGDTTSWDRGLVIDVCVLAEPFPGIAPVRRNGARSGDRLFVTGPLGGSLRGRHMRFRPRIEEAREIGSVLGGRLHAMIDVTDGLSLDLHRICTASGVGAVLDEAWLSRAISPDALAASKEDGRSPLTHALEDGEDFELLMSIEGDVPGSLSLMPIGEVTQAGLFIRRVDGSTEAPSPRGYVH